MSVAAIGLEKAPMQERYKHLLKIITSERFITMQGLGNEVPFFICPYPPEEAVEMFRMQKQLFNTIEKSGVRILVISLYDLAVELLKKRGIFEQALEIEASSDKDDFREFLQGVMDPETHLVPAIADKMGHAEFDVMFLVGVGQVFPRA